MRVDHLFWCVEDEREAEAWVARLGLHESYRRRHVGQGTTNVCCAFDDLYLEFLWVVDADEARSPAIAPTGLAERCAWTQCGACPVGVAVRGGLAGLGPTWAFTPPYLPPGGAIAILDASREPTAPLVFAALGAAPPAEWPEARRGRLQRDAGRVRVRSVTLGVPGPLDARVEAALVDSGLVVQPASRWALELTVTRVDGGLEQLTIHG